MLSALALGRFGRLGVRATTLTVAAIGFVAIYPVPFLAYPPNPPAVGRPETIGYRTAVYFLMMAISVIAAVTAIWSAAGWPAAGEPGTPAWPSVSAISSSGRPPSALMPSLRRGAERLPGHAAVRLPPGQLCHPADLWGVLGVVLAELGRPIGPAGRTDNGAVGTRLEQ